MRDVHLRPDVKALLHAALDHLERAGQDIGWRVHALLLYSRTLPPNRGRLPGDEVQYTCERAVW